MMRENQCYTPRFELYGARLIAAVPELVELVRVFVEDIGWLADANSPNSRIGKSVCIPIERARALLAKIDGGN